MPRGMIIFPAIDLKGGACVRLVRGEMDSATVFNTDPAAQAARDRPARARTRAQTNFTIELAL